jgi:hypothetical protein
MTTRKKMKRSGAVRIVRLPSLPPNTESIEEKIARQDRPTIRVPSLTMHQQLERDKLARLIKRWLKQKRGTKNVR